MTISCASYPKLERLDCSTFLGVRFWDPVYNKHIKSGLDVITWPENNPDLVCKAVLSSSGIHSFHRLAGLRSCELGNVILPESPTPQRKFLVRVLDKKHRFLPIIFCLKLPRTGNGIYPNGYDPPDNQGDPWPGVPLYSAPARTTPPGSAVIRAQLIDQASLEPATYALARIKIDGKNLYGIADHRGVLTIHLPYPGMKTIPVGTPPSTITAPFSDHAWDFKLKVFFNPEKSIYLPGGSEYLNAPELPDLKDVLEQPDVKFVHTKDENSVGEHVYIIEYGKELVLKTSGETKSVLMLDTA